MIKINLLPPEKRRSERTPLPVFLLIVLGIIILGGGGAYTYTSYKKKTDLENEAAALVVKEQTKKGEAQAVMQNRERLANLQREVTELRSVIPAEEINVTSVIAELSALLYEYPVWTDDIKIYFDPVDVQSVYKRAVDQQARSFPAMAIEIKCNTPGLDMTPATKIRNAIIKHPFFSKHFPIINKHLKLKINKESDYEEESSLNFEIQLFDAVK
jgi:hypothetical protein